MIILRVVSSDAKWLCMQIVTGDIFPQFIIFSLEAIAFLRQGFCDQGVSWSSLLDELKNFTANIFLKLVY